MKFALEEGKLRRKKVYVIHSLFEGDETDVEDIERGKSILERAKEMAVNYGVDLETKLLVRGRNV